MSNLAYLEQAVSTGLHNSGKPIQMKRVFGFDIPVEDDEHPKRVESYKDAAKSLASLLSTAGINVLATIPKAWWDKMVEDSGLIKVPNGEYFRLSLDPYVTDARNSGLTDRQAKMIIGATSALTAAVTNFIPGSVTDHVLGTLAGGMFGVAIGFGVALVINVIKAHPYLRTRSIVKSHGGRKSFITKVLRDRVEYSGFSVKFTLPTPPADVQDVLKILSARSIAPTVYADVDAIGLEYDVVSLLHTMMTDYDAKKREERSRRLTDPIITIEQNGVVAVIAQFGDFAIEKDLIDRVVKMGI